MQCRGQSEEAGAGGMVRRIEFAFLSFLKEEFILIKILRKYLRDIFSIEYWSHNGLYLAMLSATENRLMIESFWQPHSLASELCHLIQHAVYLTVSFKLNYLSLIKEDIFISILNSLPNVSFSSCT